MLVLELNRIQIKTRDFVEVRNENEVEIMNSMR